MKVCELYKEVAQLGFENSLENEIGFYQAANRALLQVAALRPEVKVFVLKHKPLENKIPTVCYEPCDKKEDLIFEAENVKSYYFEADGTGTCYLEKYNEATGNWETKNIISLASDNINIFKSYRGFILVDSAYTDARVRLRFTGEFLYSVKNVAMYADIYSENDSDIPAYAEYTRYDISSLVDDFLSFESPPIKDDATFAKLGKGYDIESGRIILLPNDISGVFRILYRHKPTALNSSKNADENDDDIDIGVEQAALLPTLIASYVWLEDEPEKAQYYYNLYKELAYNLERNTNRSAPIAITNNGW